MGRFENNQEGMFLIKSKITMSSIGDPKSIEGEIIKKYDRLQDLIEVNSDFIWETDGEMVYTYANAQSYDILGYKKEEILGRKPFDFMTHEEAGKKIKIFSEIRRSKRSFFCIEFTNIHKNGYPVFVESSGVPILDTNGNLSGFHGTDRLISRRKRVLCDVLQTNCELDKMVKERNVRLEKALESLKCKEKEIEISKLVLEKMNKTLRETNDALSVLARNIDKQKEEMEKRIYSIVKTKMLPIIRQLKSDKGCQKRLAEIDVLDMYLNDIIPKTNFFDEINTLLSNQEMRVLALIKDGLTSQHIADSLNISLYTVKTHRRNIRRKLNIRNTKANFCSYLKSKLL